MFQLDTADPRRKRMLDGSEADTSDGGETAQLSPRITATSAGGPTAYVPSPRIGAPSGQPILRAPEPTQPKQPAPAAPQSVAQVAMGTSTPPATPAPTPRIGPPAPINTMSGEWTPPTSAAGSAPLIASAAGGTMTPQGDSSNSFRGYQTSQGGGFGGAFAEKGADAALWSAVSNGDPKALRQGLSSADPELRKTAADNVARMLTMNDTEAGGVQILKNLTPEQRALVQESFVSGNPYAADQAGYDKNRNNGGQAALYKGTWDRLTSQIDAAPGGLPTGRLEGNYTAKDPEEQARLLASGATAADVGQAGPIVPQVGAPPGVTATPGKVQTTTVSGGVGGGTPAVGGGGTPALPFTPSPGIGAPGDFTNLDPVQAAMRDETLRRLQNPSPYDDALWQKEVDKAKASSDETWKRNRDSLDSDLAARGINWSSIAGDKLSDFNTARSRSWDDTLTGFLSDRAKGIGAARDQAFTAGNTERSYYDNLRQQAIGNQFDVTRLAEALRQGREGTALDWTRLGLGALGQSADNSADIGSGLAQSAAGTNTGDYLAQWIAQFYGKQAPKPGVGAPAPASAGAYG